ncbi:hypothetical protein [Vallitalea guaymasensis]|uniref:hypothetical protein n=1 Tax=Vallitalea guaymasensis TaxID=1185412 RepID=UPI000DE2733E|nr:hypothetical protein [Vallitalea guaymasensis]
MKRIIRLIVCTFLIFISVEVNIETWAEEYRDFEVDVNYGYDNIFKYNEYLPVSVHVKNNIDDFDGDVVLRYHVNNNSDGELTQRVTIEKNNSKVMKFLIPRISEELSIMKIIFRKDNKVIYEEKLTIPYTQGIYNTLMLGILTDDFDELSYINSSNDYVKVELNEQNFPSNTFASKILDIIVINNFDLSKLSQDQLDILKKWVNDGGHLVIGSGVNYSKTLTLLQDFIGIDMIDGVKEIDSDILYDYVAEEAKTDDHSLLSIALINSDKLKSTIISGDNHIVYNINKGKGRIDLFTFDLGMEPMKSFTHNNKFFEKYFKQEFEDMKILLSNSYYNYNRTNSFLNVIPGLKFPSLWSIIIIIGIYIILIGPVLYLVLKRRKKRHLMWIMVPVISIVFVGIMYISGMNTRLKEPVTQVVNILNFSEKGGSYNSFGTVLNTDKSKLDIKSNDSLYMIPLESYDYYSFNQSKNMGIKNYEDFPVSFNWKSGLEPSIEYYNSDVFSNNNFELETSKNIPVENKIQLDLLSEGTEIIGSITNNYDFGLKNCVIYFKNKVYLIDDLGSNETKNIEDMKTRNYEYFREYYWDVIDSIDSSSNFKEKNDRYQDCRMTDFNMYTYEAINTEEAIFVGWTDKNFTNGFQVNGKKTKSFEKSMISVIDTVNYVKGSNIVLEFGSVRPYINNSIGNNFIYSRDKEFSYYYKLPIETIDINKIKIRRIANMKNKYTEAKYYVVGTDNVTYQEFDDSITIEAEELDKYVNTNGELLMAVVLSEDEGEVDIPEIYIEGIGK